MDYKQFLTAFSVVFLAELGDKTQLMTLSLASGDKSRWAVFFGAALALICTTAIAVLLGNTVTQYVSKLWLERCVGAFLIAMGAYTFYHASA